MVRPSAKSRRGRVSKRRGGGRRSERAPTAEQLNFEMELMKAKREGREEEFRKEKALEKQAAKKKNLDNDMDEYFKNRTPKSNKGDSKDPGTEAGAQPSDPNQRPSQDAPARAQPASVSNK